MIKKITIAGIELDDYTARESILMLDKEMGEQPLYLVEEVTMDMLLLAQTDERMKGAIECVTHTVISDPGILEAAGVGGSQRRREIEEHEYFYGVMRRLERNHKKLFILGDKVAATEQFCQYIGEEFPKCEVEGIAALEATVGADAVVNEINAAAADAIICMMPQPERAYFLLDNKDKISASLWYGMGIEKIQPKKHRLRRWIRRSLHKKKLAEHIEKH